MFNVFLLFLVALPLHAEADDNFSRSLELRKQSCLSTREYITTIRFLREKQEYGLSEKEMVLIADQTSMGCSGASQRFINVLSLLTKMGIDTRSSVKTALAFTDKKDKFAKVFIKIFRHVYDTKYLNQDIQTSLKISLDIVMGYTENVDKALKDFRKLVGFCLKDTSMGLATPKCAYLASEMTLLGKNYPSSIAKPFIELVYFLQNDKNGPSLDRNSSIKLIRQVIKYGPVSVRNFKEAYAFAMSKKGLSLGLKGSLNFAKKMAERSVQKNFLKSVEK